MVVDKLLEMEAVENRLQTSGKTSQLRAVLKQE